MTGVSFATENLSERTILATTLFWITDETCSCYLYSIVCRHFFCNVFFDTRQKSNSPRCMLKDPVNLIHVIISSRRSKYQTLQAVEGISLDRTAYSRRDNTIAGEFGTRNSQIKKLFYE